jgi:hypothetical protein
MHIIEVYKYNIAEEIMSGRKKKYADKADGIVDQVLELAKDVVGDFFKDVINENVRKLDEKPKLEDKHGSHSSPS